MMIQSLSFLNPVFFFPVILLFCLIYYLLPSRYRWIMLLLISYAFYFLLAKGLILVLVALTFANYFLGKWIEKHTHKIRLSLLLSALLVNLFPLFFFKVFSAGLIAGVGTILLPIGLSFYTLQNLSYVIDIYKGILEAEHHLGHFAVFIGFFPKILAGPIERGKDLIPQIKQEHPYQRDDIYHGLRLISIGMFKKFVIADRLALFVNEVFAVPGTYQGVTLILAVIFLAFQIYLDFSGYSDIALGTARLFGFELTQNFKLPYLSENIAEFWNRWHVSFSSWLRDYIFYPLRRWLIKFTGKSLSLPALVLPPLFAMLASGIWHGTGLTFIIWGLYNAFFYILVVLWRVRRKPIQKSSKVGKVLRIIITFGILCGGWIIFRSKSIHDALVTYRSIFVKVTTFKQILQNISIENFYLSIILVLLVIIWEIWSAHEGGTSLLSQLPSGLRWCFYFLILTGITLLGVYPMISNTFVYFRF